jgi:hypothetical protein
LKSACYRLVNSVSVSLAMGINLGYDLLGSDRAIEFDHMDTVIDATSMTKVGG